MPAGRGGTERLNDMTLLIVDDHPIVLEGMESVLSRKGFRVLKATTAEQALSLATHVPDIDIFVVDLSLVEGTDGLTLVENLRQAGISRPVIVYTMHEELWNIATLLKADVEGIVLKGDNIRELEQAIEQVAKGRRYRSSSFARCSEEVSKTKGILSGKDIDVLRRLSKGESNRAISEAMFVSEKAVEYHRSNILRKMCARTMTEAVQRAIKLGIICLMAAVSFASGAEVPAAVDLGLSVMWADRNLGAAAPADGGFFYAFGETEPKERYDWSTYAHCTDQNLFLQHDLGVETISGTGYDAAALKLGRGWRMPTAAEARELLEKTAIEILTVDGVRCAVVSGAGEASIVIPLCGYMNGAKYLMEGKQALLWTGSFVVESGEEEGISYRVNGPDYLALTEELMDVLTGSSHLGFPIRPVYDPRTASAGKTPAPEEHVETEGVYTIDGRRCGTTTDGLPRGLYIIRYSDGTALKKAL